MGIFLSIFFFLFSSNSLANIYLAKPQEIKLSNNLNKVINETIKGKPKPSKVDYSSIINSINKNQNLDHCFNFSAENYDGDIFFSNNTKVTGNDIKFNKNQIKTSNIVFPSTIQITADFGEKKYLNFYLNHWAIKNGAGCRSVRLPFNSRLFNHELGSGNLLVSIDHGISAVNIDKKFKKVLYFDDKFNEVEKRKASYYFFKGIGSGNYLLTVKFKNRKVFKQLFHLYKNETTFIHNKFYQASRTKLQIQKSNLLASTNSTFGLDIKSAKSLFKNKSLKNIGEGLFESKPDIRLRGHRQMFQIEDWREFFVHSSTGAKRINLPSKEYLNHFLKLINIEYLNDLCVIQINLNDKLLASNFFGSDGEKNFDLDTYYLSDNGKIKTSADSNSKKIFILGYAHGIIDYRLSLEGNKSYFGQTFCAKDTYIIEQL